MKYTLIIVFILTITQHIPCVAQKLDRDKEVEDMERYFIKKTSWTSKALDDCNSGLVLAQFDISSGSPKDIEIVFSEMDQLSEIVKKAIQKSAGTWINLSREFKSVLLPIYFINTSQECRTKMSESIKDFQYVHNTKIETVGNMKLEKVLLVNVLTIIGGHSSH